MHKNQIAVKNRNVKNQRGESLISILASLVIASVAVSASVSAIMGFTKASHDDKVIIETTERARGISNLIGTDLRMLGAGMPLTQTNFLITTAGLGDAPLPILTTSTATTVAFRLNSRGRNSSLTALFDPSASFSFNLISSAGFVSGDTVYISDGTVGGSNGMKATINGVAGNTVTITGAVYNVGATFAAGSVADPVETITYANGVDGVTRTADGVTIALSPSSTVSFSYLDQNGNVLLLPLTAATIAGSLYSIQYAVNVTSTTNLSSGAVHTASLTSRASLRNINFTR